MKIKQAFTLVELIVVITILAILGTIAFLSFQGYSRDARDSVRISDLNNISRGMEFMLTKTGRLPVPEDSVEITASGTIISYQGYAGENVLSTIGVNNGGKDPKDDDFYTYVSNANYTKYQLLGFLENGDQIGLGKLNKVNADLSKRFPVSEGFEIGVIMNSVTYEPVQLSHTGFDIVNTVEKVDIHLGNNGIITGTGGEVFSEFLHKASGLLNNKNLNTLDSSLIGYWDMESLENHLGINVIKDLSGNNNHGKCFEIAQYDCGSNKGPKIDDGVVGKSLNFNDGGSWNQVVVVDDSEELNITSDEVTISGWFKFDVPLLEMRDEYPILLIKRPYEIGGYAAHFGRTSETLNMQYCFLGGCDVEYVFLPDNNTWYFYTGVKGENFIKLYINGELVIEKLTNNSISDSPGENMTIGDRFEGSIDEMRLYNRVLSSDEIYNLYLSMKND